MLQLQQAATAAPVADGVVADAGEAAKSTAAAAKQKAVMTLQKLFFEELAKGQDPNGAAARALVRLNETKAEKELCPTSEPPAANTTPIYRPLVGGTHRGGGGVGSCGLERSMVPVPPTGPRREKDSGPRRLRPGQEMRISVGN